MALSVPYTFTPNTTILSAEVNANFASLVAGAVDKTGDTLTGTLSTLLLAPTTTATYDLGTSLLKYRNLYLSGTTSLNSISYTWPVADGSGYLTSNGAGSLTWTSTNTTLKFPCCGRLTLSSFTPVPITDVTAATIIYFTPHEGCDLALYSGSSWAIYTLTEKSIAVPALATQMFDIFAEVSGGVIVLSTLSWTNDTTRATVLSTQDGVLIKSGSPTQRYLGTCRTTTVAGQTEDSAAKRFLWNYYHRVPRPMFKSDATASWVYGTVTVRQARADTTNKVEFVVGHPEVMVLASYSTAVTNDQASSQTHQIGVGYDSITVLTPTAQVGNTIVTGPTANMTSTGTATAHFMTNIGYHYIAALERGSGVGTTTWYGTGTYAGTASLTGITQA